jgi:hypothetical protein
MNTTRRRVAALLAAGTLAASGLLAPAPSDAAPIGVESLALQDLPDRWTGDWLLKGQIDDNRDEVADNGGRFVEFGVITLQKVIGAAAEAAINEEADTGGSFFTGTCLREISDGAEGHVYRGSYEFGTGGSLWGCADDSLEGLEVYIHYHGNDGGHGEILVKWEAGNPQTFFGDYGPPHFDPQLHWAEYLKIRGTKVKSQRCEAPDSAASTLRAPVRSRNSHSPTTTARLAETPTELARPFPIEGVWRLCGQDIEVRPGTEEGTFVGAAFGGTIGFLGCDTVHQQGIKIWDIRIESSTPTSTHYGGTFDCEGERQAKWEVVLHDEDVTKDRLYFCFAEPAPPAQGCELLNRRGPATRRFDMTLTMNAIGRHASGKKKGEVTPAHPSYVTTTAELNDGGFDGRWHGGQDRFGDLIGERGTLIIEDIFFGGVHPDESTVLEMINVFGIFPYHVSPGRDAAGLLPSAFVRFRVRVQSSDWKRCKDDTEGFVTLGWNRRRQGTTVDLFKLDVCGRDRIYVHNDPDDQSRVDVEVKQRPPN